MLHRRGLPAEGSLWSGRLHAVRSDERTPLRCLLDNALFKGKGRSFLKIRHDYVFGHLYAIGETAHVELHIRLRDTEGLGREPGCLLLIGGAILSRFNQCLRRRHSAWGIVNESLRVVIVAREDIDIVIA